MMFYVPAHGQPSLRQAATPILFRHVSQRKRIAQNADISVAMGSDPV